MRFFTPFLSLLYLPSMNPRARNHLPTEDGRSYTRKFDVGRDQLAARPMAIHLVSPLPEMQTPPTAIRFWTCEFVYCSVWK